MIESKASSFPSVVVPASTSNLGPGFDCLGAAVDLFLRVRTAPTDRENGVRLEYQDGRGPDVEPEEDLLYKGLKQVLRKEDAKEPSWILNVESNIPTSGGLGSSAAASAAGLALGAHIAGIEPEDDWLFEEGFRLEGHPDNIAPSVYGGITISYVTQNGPGTVRIAPEFPAELILIRSDVQVETREARERLPGTVDHEDAVFNLTRTALLVHALENGRLDLLQEAIQDRIHQPYRAKLIPGGGEALKAGYEAGALGIWISGAGPTIACLVKDGDRTPVRTAAEKLRENGHEIRVQTVNSDSRGLRVSTAD